MDYLFLLYILISVGIAIGGPYMLVQQERTLGAFLFFVGAVLIFVFYGLRWFQGDSLKMGPFKVTQWPPVINTCPDFLTLTKVGSGTSATRVCVDLIGVSRGGLMKVTNLQDVDVNATNKIFRLFDDLTGVARQNALCQECKDKGVTWEGVYDGVSCTGATYGSAAAAAAGTPGCPTTP